MTAHRFRYSRNSLFENCIISAINAIKNPNIQALETDIQLTKDGVFVLMNPLTIDMMTELEDGKKNKISDYTYDELKEMNFHANLSEIEKVILTCAKEFGSESKEYLKFYNDIKNNIEFFKIATLDELLALNRNGKHLFIEIKTNYTKEESKKSIEYAKKLMSVLKNYNTSDITIIGRDVNTLEKIKEEDKDISCFPVVGAFNKNDNEKLTYAFDGVSIVYDHLGLNVPGTNKLAWEFLAETGNPIAVWNIRTRDVYYTTKELLSNGQVLNDFYPTGDFIDEVSQKSR